MEQNEYYEFQTGERIDPRLEEQYEEYKNNGGTLEFDEWIVEAKNR